MATYVDSTYHSPTNKLNKPATIMRRPSTATTVGSESPTRRSEETSNHSSNSNNNDYTTPEQSSSSSSSPFAYLFESMTMLTTSPTSAIIPVSSSGSLYPVVTDLDEPQQSDDQDHDDCCGVAEACLNHREWMQGFLGDDDQDHEQREQDEQHSVRHSRQICADELPPLPDISDSSNHHHHHRRNMSAMEPSHPKLLSSSSRSSSSGAAIPTNSVSSTKQQQQPRHAHRRAYSEGAATLLLRESQDSQEELLPMGNGTFEDFYVLTRPVCSLWMDVLVVLVLVSCLISHTTPHSSIHS